MLKQLVLRSILVLICMAAMSAWAKTVVIDVRTPAEFATGHIDGALNIDHEAISQRISAAGVSKDDEVILYCRSGRRSGIALQSLNKLGYKRVVNYGGIDDARKRLLPK